MPFSSGTFRRPRSAPSSGPRRQHDCLTVTPQRRRPLQQARRYYWQCHCPAETQRPAWQAGQHVY